MATATGTVTRTSDVRRPRREHLLTRPSSFHQAGDAGSCPYQGRPSAHISRFATIRNAVGKKTEGASARRARMLSRIPSLKA